MFGKNNDDQKKTWDLHPVAGIWSGVGELFNNPGTYYTQANWKGGGLANTGLGFMANPYSRDYASAGKALSAASALRKLYNLKNNNEYGATLNSGYGSNDTFNMLGRLSALGGRVGNWVANFVVF